MLKLRDLFDETINYLKNNLPGILVEKGKVGELPSVTPCIWVYIEPTNKGTFNSSNSNIARKCQVHIFCCSEARSETMDAFFDGIEIAEKVEKLVIMDSFTEYLDSSDLQSGDNIPSRVTFPDDAISTDSIINGIAATQISFYVNYSSSAV